jgi:LPPG:FO 2-phospho-L-lactate transferase
MIVALAGGTGAAKLLRGLAGTVAPSRLAVIGNTGDDFECWGLHVSPDLDSVTYALAGLGDRERGWGVGGDTFQCLEAMRRLGGPDWFQLGDRDLATHLFRTQRLRGGATLSAATAAIGAALGVRARVIPMSDDPVRTRLLTATGWLDFQEFLVRDRARPAVREVTYAGAESAHPAPGVIEAIHGAEAIVVCCSNPVTSIAPILAVPGVVAALAGTPAPVIAVSPLIGEAPVTGPAGRLLSARGLPVSAVSIAELYRPWLDLLVVDHRDAGLAAAIAERGARAVAAATLMTDAAHERDLARAVLDAVGVPPEPGP